MKPLSFVFLSLFVLCFATAAIAQTAPSLATDKPKYSAGESIMLKGSDWTPGEPVTITISAEDGGEGVTVTATADADGTFTTTATMPDDVQNNAHRLESNAVAPHLVVASSSDNANFHATAKGSISKATAEADFSEGVSETDGEHLLELEGYWNDRLTLPTGKFNPGWVRKAAQDDKKVTRGTPKGKKKGHNALKPATQGLGGIAPLALNDDSFTPLGPSPERMTGCSGCFNYTTTQGRVNTIVVDPTTTTNGSIVAYAGTVGGGVWKTTNCCSASTTWAVTTDDPLISTTAIDSLTIDPNDHNTIYAGTGDLNYGSFSMGSQGVLKSTDAGATWTVLGADIFGPALAEPAGQFPQYAAVGKVRVDPNNSNRVVAGSKSGLYFSYDGGANWTGPCLTNSFTSMRQDITGLELTNMGSGVTRILAAVGVRGFATTVQFNLGDNGANGIYKSTMPSSGCPSFTSIASNANGFVFGTAVSGSPYATGANLNATSGNSYVNLTTGNQLGRVDIGVAPSNPNVIYAQVQSIAFNNNGGCGNTNGCQLGVFSSNDGGATWSMMPGSAGGALRNCATTGSASAMAGDYPQNWYDQAIAVDPNNADRVYISTFDVWYANRATGTSFNDVTCGYTYPGTSGPVHVDQHALAFVPGSSSILLLGNDGGVHGTINADAGSATVDPTFFNMDSGMNTIEFYSGDISGNFANSSNPQASGGAQDNGPSSVLFAGSPTAAAQWQMGLGGDGFYSRIDPVGTGTSLRFWQGNNSGGLSRCIGVTSTGIVRPCTDSGATWSSKRGAWTGDTQAFMLPFDIFRGGIPGGDDCPAAATNGGCGHLIAGTTRVWETITGNSANTNGAVTWYVTNSASQANLTKGTLGNRSFINQVKYAPKTSSVAIAGTNDANVQIGFNMGAGVAGQTNWVNVSGGNAILPLRPVLGIALDPTTTTAPVGYAAVGGFNANTPSNPGHIFKVVCNLNCASFSWSDRTGNLPDIPVDSIIVNPNFPTQVFAGTDFGLYYTDDVTANPPVWQRFSNGLPAVMIWDMQIDRGATTLSLWTRGRGAYVWPLPTGPENPLPVVLSVSPVNVTYGDSATLSATMTSGGNPVTGKSITFTVNGTNSVSATTDGSGTATVVNASLSGIPAGTYATGVNASFAGDTIYANASATALLKIAQKNLTGSITANNKEYDGTTSATIASRTLSGVVGTDVVSYTGGTATFSDANVGVAKTVTATGLGLSGADSGNYTVNSTATTTADITKAVLTVTANSTSRLYSYPNPVFTASYSGFKNGETLATSGVTGSPVLTTTATQLSAVGSYPINIALGTLAAGNYSFKLVDGTLNVLLSGIVGLDSVSIGATKALADSFDSTIGYPSSAGNAALILSNGSIDISGTIAGNVLSAGGSVSLGPGSVVSGNVTAATTIANKGTAGSLTPNHPSALIVANVSADCGSFTTNPALSGKFSYSNGDLSVASNSDVTLGGGTYCFHSITLTGSSTLRVSAPVVINLTGTMNTTGGSLVNATSVPSSLQIVSSFRGADGVKIAGNASAYLTIYAPGTDITVTGGSPVFGALLGKTLTISGNSQVHYDVELPSIWSLFGF